MSRQNYVICLMNDAPTYWIGESLEACKKACATEWSAEEIEYAEQVSDAALDRLRVSLTDENEKLTGETMTFREYAAREYPDGITGAEFFAGED